MLLRISSALIRVSNDVDRMMYVTLSASDALRKVKETFWNMSSNYILENTFVSVCEGSQSSSSS